MKKIMKKALSLILVLALAIVPMTVMAAEGESIDEPKALASRDTEVTVPANSTVYFADTYNPMMGDSSVMAMTVKGATGFAVSTSYNPWQGWKATTNDTEGKVECNNAAFSMGMGGTFYFAIENKTSSSQNYTIKITVPVGVEANQDTLKNGENKANTFGDYNGYFYSYTAPADGELTLSFDPTAGWLYIVMDDEYNYLLANGTEYSDNDPQVPVSVIDVTANETYMVVVNTYDPQGGMNQNPAGTVTFDAYFEADVKADSNANDGNGYDSLVVGTNDVVQNGTVNTTIYTFEPTETGTYKISAVDGMVVSTYIGSSNYVGGVDKAPAASVEVTCTSVGQSFMIGVASSDAWVPTTQVTIEKTAEYIPPVEVQWTIYENETTPQAFDYKGGELEYVNIEDTTVDKAVLGTDGYYHLNSADGKILYVDLDDTALISLSDAAGYYGLKVIKTENGEVTEKISYNEAVLAYYECADAETGLYPLTKDLMDMLQAVGENQGWYAENGQVPVTTEDAWMFACYYEKTSTPATTPVKPAPDTGDSANMMVWAIVMVVAAGAAVVAFESKRRAR